MWNTHTISQEGETEEGTAVQLSLPEPCRTPHLVFELPSSTIVVSGCRCTNPGDAADCPGALALVDWSTNEVAMLDAPTGAEGLAVTAAGDMWVGGPGGAAMPRENG